MTSMRRGRGPGGRRGARRLGGRSRRRRGNARRIIRRRIKSRSRHKRRKNPRGPHCRSSERLQRTGFEPCLPQGENRGRAPTDTVRLRTPSGNAARRALAGIGRIAWRYVRARGWGAPGKRTDSAQKTALQKTYSTNFVAGPRHSWNLVPVAENRPRKKRARTLVELRRCIFDVNLSEKRCLLTPCSHRRLFARAPPQSAVRRARVRFQSVPVVVVIL